MIDGLDCQWNRERTFDFVCDNENVVNVIVGISEPEKSTDNNLLDIFDSIGEVFLIHNWGPRHANGPPVRWVRRDFNAEADWLANVAMNTRSSFHFINQELVNDKSIITNIQGWSDGGSRDLQNVSSYGWILKAWVRGMTDPVILTAGAAYLDHAAESSSQVEVLGVHAVWRDFVAVLRGDSMPSNLQKTNGAWKRRKLSGCIASLGFRT